MQITNASNGEVYEVDKKVADTERYRLYLCSSNGSAGANLLQVASSIEHNGVLDRTVYMLSRLLQEAEDLEAAYAKIKHNPKHMLNYQCMFPEIVDTFVSEDQGNRRVNILRFRGVEDVRSMAPLHNLVHKDQMAVDLKTSVWILGRLLKALVFLHDSKVAVSDLSLGNILIEPEKHSVVIFNWAEAQLMPNGVPSSIVREEIKTAACIAISVLGGSLESGIPDDGSAEFEAYRNHIFQLAQVGDNNATTAHQEFYSLVDSLWPRGFHPFTFSVTSRRP